MKRQPAPAPIAAPAPLPRSKPSAACVDAAILYVLSWLEVHHPMRYQEIMNAVRDSAAEGQVVAVKLEEPVMA